MPTEPDTYVTPEEYLAHEQDAESKSEYWHGKIAALPGASPEHIAITTNVAGELRLQLMGRPYRVFANHLRIKVEATEFYTYPDVVVLVDKPIIALEGERPNTVLNPILIVEVMSAATEDADRNQKFENYRQIPSLREIILIPETSRRIESYIRGQDGSWAKSEVDEPDELIYLASIDCTLTPAEVYAELKAPRA